MTSLACPLFSQHKPFALNSVCNEAEWGKVYIRQSKWASCMVCMSPVYAYQALAVIGDFIKIMSQ